MKISVKTIGLNIVIIKDASDLNKITFEVVRVHAWNKKDLIAVVGTFDAALSIAQGLAA